METNGQKGNYNYKQEELYLIGLHKRLAQGQRK